MKDVGASQSTISMIASYLTGRKAVLTLEGWTASTVLTRVCPQASQLGPSLWNLSMDRALKINEDARVKVLAYADDLAVLVSGTGLVDIQGRAGRTLVALNTWAAERGLTFSVSKSQVLPLKGGLEQGFSIPFGKENIISVGSVRYLCVELDSKRNFWEHVQSVAGKSEDLYSRLRAATSAYCGVRQATSRVS